MMNNQTVILYILKTYRIHSYLNLYLKNIFNFKFKSKESE